jgi:two-component system cell cycle response regulator
MKSHPAQRKHPLVSSRSVHNLLWPILLVMAVSLATIGALLLFAFNTLDASSRAGSKERVGVALAVESDRLKELLTEYTYWDEAYRNLITRPNLKWADDNIGSYMTENRGIDFSLAVTAAGKPSVVFVAGEPGRLPLDEILSAGLARLLEKCRAGDGKRPLPASGYIVFGGVTYLLAVDQFVPEQAGDPPRDGAYLAVAKRMDRTLINEVSLRYRLPRLQLLASESDRDGLQTLTLVNPLGEPVLRLAWSSPRPAYDLLARLLPLLGLVALVMALLTWWLLRAEANRRRGYEKLLHNLATTDSLTGIFNRREFLRLAEGEVSRSRRYDNPISLIMLDVDHFKRINDRFGHATGDEVLVRLAATVNSRLRKIDVFGRMGGEEFAILLPMTSEKPALEVAERIRKSLTEMTCIVDGQEIHVTASFGVASLGVKETLKSLLVRADDALYGAKHQGRNRSIMSETTPTEITEEKGAVPSSARERHAPGES